MPRDGRTAAGLRGPMSPSCADPRPAIAGSLPMVPVGASRMHAHPGTLGAWRRPRGGQSSSAVALPRSPDARGPAGGARADGGHHQPGVPPAVSRVRGWLVRAAGLRGSPSTPWPLRGRQRRDALLLARRGPLRVGDDHVARPARAQRRDDGPHPLRPDESPRSAAALRGRSRDRGRRRAHGRRRRTWPITSTSTSAAPCPRSRARAAARRCRGSATCSGPSWPARCRRRTAACP